METIECPGCDRELEGMVCDHCGYDLVTGKAPPAPLNLDKEVAVYIQKPAYKTMLMQAARRVGVRFIDEFSGRFRFSVPNGEIRTKFVYSLWNTKTSWYYMQWHGNPNPPVGRI